MLATRSPLRPPHFFAIGGAAAVVGLLPWLVAGMRLPLQNLWASSTLPGEMPFALLPFSQYYVVLIASLILVGSAIAGIAGRTIAAGNPGKSLLALLAGVLIVQLVAVGQTAITVGAGLSERTEATLYVVALTGGTIVTIAVGLGILALIARGPKPVALIALSISAIALGRWLGALVRPVGSVPVDSPVLDALIEVIQLIPAVLIGATIAWSGISSIGRVIAAIASLAVLWIGPTLVTAISAATGTRVLAKYPAEMLDYGVGVLLMALGMPELWGTSLVVAIAVAAIGLVGKRTLIKRSGVEADTVD
jgi:hypothetical protein